MKFIECQELSEFNCRLDGLDIGSYVLYGKLECYSCQKTEEDRELVKEVQQHFQQEKIRIKREHAHETAAPSAVRRVNVPYGSTVKTIVGGEIKTENGGVYSSSVPPKMSTSVPSRFNNTVNQYLNNPYSRARSGSYGASNNLSAKSPSSPFSPFSTSSVFADLIATLNESYPDYDFKRCRPEDFSKEQGYEHVYNSVNLSLRDGLTPNQRTSLWQSIDSVIHLTDCEIYTYNPDDDEDPLAMTAGKIWTWNYLFYNKKVKRVLFFVCYAKSKSSLNDYDDDMDDVSEYDTSYTNTKNRYVHVQSSMDDDDEDVDLDDL